MTKAQTRLVLAVAVLLVLGCVAALQHFSTIDPEMELDHNFTFVQRDGAAPYGSEWLPEENGWRLGIDTRGHKLSAQSVSELVIWPDLRKLELRGEFESAAAEQALLTQFEETLARQPGSRRFQRPAAVP